MIKITATAESVKQARDLLEAGVDVLYIGEERFGLRLPQHFTRSELKEITDYAHLANKEVAIAVNAIMHPESMREIPEYLNYLESIHVDQLVVGDPGVIYLLTKDDTYHLPYIYDGATMVTSARQINFWAHHEAIGAVIAREVPYAELKEMIPHLEVPGEILVYGATAIHQSKRPLLQNYYNFIQADEEKGKERELYLSEPKKEDTHYSIFEDKHGTHIFANNDIDLMLELQKLHNTGYDHWKLDGIYTSGENFVAITKLFIEAKRLIEAGEWDLATATILDSQVRTLHPAHRGLDEGFFNMSPDEIK